MDDLVEQLERLAALRKDGSLTDPEYADAKRQLLDGHGVVGDVRGVPNRQQRQARPLAVRMPR